MYEGADEASPVSLSIQTRRQYQFLFTATALFPPPTHWNFSKTPREKETEFTLPGKLFLGIASVPKHVCAVISRAALAAAGQEWQRSRAGWGGQLSSPCPTARWHHLIYCPPRLPDSSACFSFQSLISHGCLSLASVEAISDCCTTVPNGNLLPPIPKGRHNQCSLNIPTRC